MKHLKVGLFLVAGLLFLLGASCTTSTSDDETAEVTDTEVSDTMWSTSTDRGDIPDTPMSGTLNGADWVMASATVTKWDNDYDFDFSNLSPDDTCGVVISDDAVNFSTNKLETGTFSKKFEEEVEFESYHSYYHYNQEDDTPMSVNVEWEAKVVISEVDEANNKVSGWAEFKFNDDLTNVSGSFEADLCE